MKFVIFTLLFCFAAAPAVYADNTRPAAEKETDPPAAMSDEALASYISGRLRLLLEGDGYGITQECNSTGCSVVVQ
jgi:hypothetical protein